MKDQLNQSVELLLLIVSDCKFIKLLLTIIIILIEPAVISAIVPMLINQKENVPAQLSCGAVGQPLPLIKWYNPNGDELMDSDSIRIQTHTSFMSITSFLLFNPLKYEYTGNYNCTAINLAHGLGNPVSMDTQSVTVTVQSKLSKLKQLNV